LASCRSSGDIASKSLNGLSLASIPNVWRICLDIPLFSALHKNAVLYACMVLLLFALKPHAYMFLSWGLSLILYHPTITCL
jgi:hypothetical protein